MTHAIYASFPNAADGKRAVGALMDHGVRKEQLSLLVSEKYTRNNPDYWASEVESREDGWPKIGVTTTTGGDAAMGAAKGAGVGLVLGVVAALAALVIPGFGLVIGGGALATALASTAGTLAAGAVAGGVTGYLKDQGVPEHHAATYHRTLSEGGAMLAVTYPSDGREKAEIETLLAKYGAVDARSYPTGDFNQHARPATQ